MAILRLKASMPRTVEETSRGNENGPSIGFGRGDEQSLILSIHSLGLPYLKKKGIAVLSSITVLPWLQRHALYDGGGEEWVQSLNYYR